MTKREMFEQILANYTMTADEVAFIEHEIELLANRSSASGKPSAKQVANNGIKDTIYAEMEEGKLYTITDMMKELPCCADLSNQRVSALVKQMIPTRVEKIVEKRRAYFRKVC